MFCWLYLSHTGWLTSLPTLSALNHLLPVSSGVISLPYCSQLFAHFHLCSKTEKWRRGRKRLNIKRPGEKKKKLHWHGKLFSVTVWELKVKVQLLYIKTLSFNFLGGKNHRILLWFWNEVSSLSKLTLEAVRWNLGFSRSLQCRELFCCSSIWWTSEELQLNNVPL